MEKKTKKPSGDQLNGLDGVFLFLESRKTPMHVGGLYIFEPPENRKSPTRLEDIRNYLSARLHLAKPFLNKLDRVPLDLDYPYWVHDKDFDIDNHINTRALSKPGNWRDLCTLVSEIIAEPVNLGRPLWQFTLITGLDKVEGVPKGSFALLTKIHHAAIDGASGVDIERAIFSKEPGSPAPKSRTDPAIRENPAMLAKVSRAQWNLLSLPWRQFGSIRALVPGFLRVVQGVAGGRMHLPPLAAPPSRFNINIDAERSFGGTIVSFGDIKTIRQAVSGSTINDVVLAIVGGAMARYLLEKGDNVDAPLLAMTPISVRTTKDAGATGNEVANMTVSLGSHIENPLFRLSHIHESAKNAKKLTTEIGAKAMSEASKHTAPWLANISLNTYSRFGVTALTRPGTNTTVTNVPGPVEQHYMDGSRLIRQFNVAPLMHGMGLVHTIFSYCGELSMAFNACRAMIPDPDFYEECLQESTAELLAAANGGKAK